MSLKLNIRPEIEAEMDELIPKSEAKSKTDYINKAISEYNQAVKRKLALVGLKEYFKAYAKESKKILSDFNPLTSYAD